MQLGAPRFGQGSRCRLAVREIHAGSLDRDPRLFVSCTRLFRTGCDAMCVSDALCPLQRNGEDVSRDIWKIIQDCDKNGASEQQSKYSSVSVPGPRCSLHIYAFCLSGQVAL